MAKSGSKTAFIYMTVIAVLYLVFILLSLFSFVFYGGILNIGLQGESFLTPSTSIFVIIWFFIILVLVFISGRFMRERATLKKGIILAFITFILSFFNIFLLVGAILGLVTLFSKKPKRR